MDRMSFCLVVFQSIPETAILISLGLILIGYKPKLKFVLIVACAESLASVLIRSLPLFPGINVFIQLPILIILTSYFCRLNVLYAAFASLLGLIIIALTETAFNFMISLVSGISIQQVLENPLFRLLFPIPEFIFLIVMFLIIRRYDLKLFDIQELKNMEQMKDDYEK